MRILLLLLPLLGSMALAERTCRILFLAAPQGAPTQLHLFDGKESREVTLTRKNLSPVYELPSGALKLQLLPQAFESLEKLPAGAPSVMIPEHLGHFYLLIGSDPNNQVAPVQMRVIAADDKGLKDGDMLWFNLTQFKVAGELEDKKLVLEPGDIKRIEAPIDERGAYAVDLFYKRDGSEHVHPVCSTKWRHDPRSRSLVFLMTIPGRQAPVAYSFRDARH